MENPQAEPEEPTASGSRSGPAAHRADLQLVRRVVAGDPASLDAFIERLRCVPRILYRLNERFRGPLAEADLADLSQDVLVLIWEKLRTFQGRSTLETWVYGFCTLESMNRFRRSKRRKRLSQGGYDAAVQSVPAPEVTQSMEYESIEIGLAEVSPPEAEVIRLKHFEGKTFREIADQLSIPANTAKTQYYRGLDWLRRRVQTLDDGEA